MAGRLAGKRGMIKKGQAPSVLALFSKARFALDALAIIIWQFQGGQLLIISIIHDNCIID